ncbi:MAG: DegT/DnrJ/EryC1/StrS family aminotransferase [candidate division Zixibacteria bacterium]|nr:DegT/DnrJ/EryC1/StrS family aminotransferase [candidate division Zixibacteria bacterium]
MPVPLIDLTRQYQAIKPEIDAAIARVFGHGGFILGGEVKNFEAAIAERCGVAEAVGVASGSDALLLTMRALGIGPGDEVIMPTFTFFATASAVTRLGATPVFCDINAADYNLDSQSVAAAISRNTKAIIAVELYGQMPDMVALRALTFEHGLYLVEDAAQALGGSYERRPAGTCGDAGCFSFFPTKNLGAAGDGGMVVTDDPQLAETVRLLRAHGAKPKYYHQVVGYNSRLDALQAAILLAKLPHLDEWSKGRRQHAAAYDRALAGVGDLILPSQSAGARHIYHQYTVATRQRDALRQYLTAAKIGSEIYYPRPLHLQECFAAFGGRVGDCPVAEEAAATVLSLPIFPEMTQGEQAEVIDCIKRFYQEN